MSDDPLVSLTINHGITILEDRYKARVMSSASYEFEWLGHKFNCSKSRLKDGGWLYTVSGFNRSRQFSCAHAHPHPQDEWMGCRTSAEMIMREALPRFEFEMRKAAAS